MPEDKARVVILAASEWAAVVAALERAGEADLALRLRLQIPEQIEAMGKGK